MHMGAIEHGGFHALLGVHLPRHRRTARRAVDRFMRRRWQRLDEPDVDGERLRRHAPCLERQHGE